jgi:nitrite reductase/ring-hydroxylating ferredoxin subunit
MADWVLVAKEDELGQIMRIEFAGREIAIFRLEDGVFALDDICSHEYARLSEGEVWGDRVYCPRHGSSFDIRSGSVAGLPATLPVETFPVKIEKGGIYVYTEEW